MSITALTVNQLKQNNYAVVAGDLVVSLQALDATNGNSFVATGREVLIVTNTDASAHTFTITSVAERFGRTDSSLTSYSVAAGAFVAIQMSILEGWLQPSDSTVHMTTSSALLKAIVVRTN
jgi:hypothetical protein